MAKESNFRNMVLCLLVVCTVTSALLALVYSFTKAPIEAAETAKKNAAVAAVVPAFDNVPGDEVFRVFAGDSVNVYPARMGSEIVGYAVEASSSKGFGGTVKLMVGFRPDGTIVNTAVVSHAETPGLGDKMSQDKSDFSLQFNGKNPSDFRLSVKKDGGDVDAITAATISSRAFCDAVDQAYRAFSNIGGRCDE